MLTESDVRFQSQPIQTGEGIWKSSNVYVTYLNILD